MKVIILLELAFGILLIALGSLAFFIPLPQEGAEEGLWDAMIIVSHYFQPMWMIFGVVVIFLGMYIIRLRKRLEEIMNGELDKRGGNND